MRRSIHTEKTEFVSNYCKKTVFYEKQDDMKRFFITTVISIVSQVAVAQWKFTVSLSTSGCGDSMDEKIAWQIAEGQVNYWMGEGYETFHSKSECEQSRQFVMSRSFNLGNCRIRYIASPCTGHSGGAIGSVDILGVSKGGSFYSTNPVNDINDWSNDDMERMLALDKNFNSFEPTNVSTGDPNYDNARSGIDPNKKFVSVNLRDDNGNIVEPNEYYFGEVMSPNDERWNYFLEKEFTDELHSEYFQEKKINIEDVLLKDNKTQFEIDLIRDYEIWRDNKLAESELYKNMAICSAMSYIDADKSMMTNNTDFRFITNDQTPESQQVLRALQLIESCNNDNQNEGFHADMFYNEKTNEYVVSFRGTEATWEDIKTDIEQGAGVVPIQYRMAIEIGDVIRQIVSDNPDIKISITGHSLGGGLATIAGVVSGQPTVVFNPAGVHKNTFEYAGVSDKVAEGNYNIVRISDTHDLLTNAQENTALSPIRESARALLFSAAKYKTKDDIISANYASAALPSATGQLKVIDSGHKGMLAPIDGHRIVPMAEKLIATHETFKNSMKSDDNLRQFRVYISE